MAGWLNSKNTHINKTEAGKELRETLKQDFLEKRQEAEKAAYAYCCSCEIGAEREQAFEIYERIRNATRLYA
tara:strand:- start:1217 stop:1432 length:216 start_codon:yes stop_codon:yes gene_type:complete